MSQQIIEYGQAAPVAGASPWLYAARKEFTEYPLPILSAFTLKDFTLEAIKGRQSIWLHAVSPSGGGLMFRTMYSPDEEYTIEEQATTDTGVRYDVSSVIGRFRIMLEIADRENSLIHWTVSITPDKDLKIPFWPTDIYPVDGNRDPLNTKGNIYAAQRGAGTAFLYMTLREPKSGSILYFQDLTSLNPYCEKTHASPETRVGGAWPEIGYTPPTSEREPIRAGEEMVISDAFACLSAIVPENDREMAYMFLDMLAAIYRRIPKIDTEYRDWPRRADGTVNDLSDSPACTSRYEGHRYVNAYVGTGEKCPESLVQLSILLPMVEYANWSGKHIPLVDEIKDNLSSFYDDQVHSVLRYLKVPAEKAEKEGDRQKCPGGPYEMDSWYLYHPLANLARMAKMGDEGAGKLFMDSLDYAVKVAHEFDYKWPVIFNAWNLQVKVKGAKWPSIPGEADVPGLYAYVMMEAWELTGDDMYLEEAKQAGKALEGLGFNVGYQYNNTAWGANALLRIWKATGDKYFLDLAHVNIASIFQDFFMWECRYGCAKYYDTFMAAGPLHNGPYMAVYEEIEVFSAFHEFVRLAEDVMPDSFRLLLTEYCKYALHRGWTYYPGELPEEIICQHPKEGHIERSLNIPLEDLYVGWDQPGQVGQEVYGAGTPLAFVTRSYHKLERMPFVVYCDYPVTSFEADDKTSTLSLRVFGDPDYQCRLRLIPMKQRELPDVHLQVKCGDDMKEVDGRLTQERHMEYSVAGDSSLEIKWSREREQSIAA